MHASLSTLSYSKFDGMWLLRSLDTSVLGLFGLWAWLICKIVAGGCGVSTVINVRFRVIVMVMD